jgi:hypothetical protein
MFAPENGAGGSGQGAQGAQAGQQGQQNSGGTQGQQGGGTGAQGSGAGPSASGSGGQASGAGAQGSQDQIAPYRPEGLPDHLLGQSDKETLDKLFGAYKGSRDAIGAFGELPKEPTGYKVEFGDKVKPFTEGFAKDALWGETLKLAHAAGIREKQFNAFVPKLLEHMVTSGLVQAPVDPQAELLQLAPASAANLDDAGKKTEAGRRLQHNIAWVDGLREQLTGGSNADPQAEPLRKALDWLSAQTADSLHANVLVEWMQGQGKEVRPALNGGKPASGTDKASVQARMNDPRNDPRSQKFEKAFADETDRLSKQVFG